MRNVLTVVASLCLLWGVSISPACAQKGMGDPAGLARQGVKPEVVSLAGKVAGVETGPCEMGTGRASIGTHFLLDVQKGDKKGDPLNIHLGPAAAVDFIADQLSAGQKVTIEAFRTEKMPKNHYVAKSVTLDGKAIRLRDDAFRPFWLLGPGVPGGRVGAQGQPDATAAGVGQPGNAALPARGAVLPFGWVPGQGRGRGYGPAPGWGRGAGYRRGAAWGGGAGYGRGARVGRGAGFGRGAGAARAGAYGWGRGAAAGRGAGWGRGWAFLDEDRDGVCDRYERLSGER